MAVKGTSTVEAMDDLLADFASRHNVRIRLAKKFGHRWEFVAGGRELEGMDSWRFSIGPRFALLIEAPQFPEKLVDDLTVLGEELMKRIHEKGI